MKHLESCVKRAIAVRTAREDYNDSFPMHCESCEGWGGTIDVQDPSMALDSVFGDNSLDIDDCESCIQRDKCPRCGSDYITDSESADYEEDCSFCGFILGVTEGKPYPHECFCIQLDANTF
jgi:hypothetical protein